MAWLLIFAVCRGMVSFSSALDQVLNNIRADGGTAAEVAATSGVTESRISEYRSGKCQINTKSLEKIINALPDYYREQYLRILLGAQPSRLGMVSSILKEVSSEEYLGFALSMLIDLFLESGPSRASVNVFAIAFDQVIAKASESELAQLLEIVAKALRSRKDETI